MRKSLAFVLGGGGARGALQVGALRALLEAGYEPDLLVGTSIGAVNAVGLALWGRDLAGVEALENAYEEVAASRLMDPRLARFAALGVLTGRPYQRASQRMREFLVGRGITLDLCFGRVSGVRLGLVSADLNSGEAMIHGSDPEQSILEGLMASTALPPWFTPIETDGRCLIDGGAFSNLPIEPALRLGATEIIALDLNDPVDLVGSTSGHGQFLEKLLPAMFQRQIYLEMELAAARRVPVRYVCLKSSPVVPIWDFRTYRDLFKTGYEAMVKEMSGWRKPNLLQWFSRVVHRAERKG